MGLSKETWITSYTGYSLDVQFVRLTNMTLQSRTLSPETLSFKIELSETLRFSGVDFSFSDPLILQLAESGSTATV